MNDQRPKANYIPWPKLISLIILVPSLTTVLLHIPAYLEYPQQTITAIGWLLTALGGLSTLITGACAILDDEADKTVSIVAVAICAASATGGVLIICRSALF